MMADAHPPTAKRSTFGFWKEHPIALTIAMIGVFAILAVTSVAFKKVGLLDSDFFDFFASDEAPIRVRNGSLDLNIVSSSQQWKESGDHWQIKNASRFTDNYEVSAAVKAGATCGGSTTATGSDVVFTYSDGKVVRVQSQGNKTRVRPQSGATMTWDASTPQKLSYAATGYIATIAVGNGANPTTMCTFTAANQLDHVLLLNVP